MAVTVAVLGLWPVPGVVGERSWVELLLGDPILVGMLRLAIGAAALYFIASVPALVIAGRWAKGLGTGGIVADDARAGADALEQAMAQVATLRSLNAHLRKEKAELWDLLDVETRPNRMGT
jgi:hypothetical protein